jgi:threonine dehydratase
MQAVAEYLAKQDEPKRVLVVLSGGNISAQTMATLFQDDHLSEPPHIEMLNR